MPKCTQYSREEKSHARRQARPIPLQPPLTNMKVENKRPADAESAPDPPHLSRLRIEFSRRGICAVTAASTQAGDCQGGFAVGLSNPKASC